MPKPKVNVDFTNEKILNIIGKLKAKEISQDKMVIELQNIGVYMSRSSIIRQVSKKLNNS